MNFTKQSNLPTKKIFFIITTLLCTTELTLAAKNKKQSQKKTSSEILFRAEDGSTGQYWSVDATAMLNEEAYIKVVAIDKKQLNTKAAQKSKKHKDYLGSFPNKKTKKIYYLYGIIKNPAPVDDSPDADVLTEKAIKMDYGPGE